VNRYPLALCTRQRVLVLSSGIIPSRRYSAIGFCQSASGLCSPTTSATFPTDPRLGVIGPTKAPGWASDIGGGPFSPGGVSGMGIELPSFGETLDECAGVSSLSRIEGFNKSYVNTLRGGGSRLDLSSARASATSLSHRRI
jgi:hypothetical protein